MNGTTIEGYYPSISEALTATTTGEVVEISDDYTSTVDVTVGNGKTLKPQSGSELKFASGKYLYVNSGGNLTASGATFTNSSGIWNGIKYQSGSSGSLTNCTISDARYGVYLNGSSRTINNCSITTAGTSTNYGIYINSASPTITDCDITGTEFSNTTIVSYGIYCYGDDDEPTISDNIIEATYGIYIYDSSPDIDGNEVVSESVGLYCENNASPFLVEAASHGNNQFSGDFSEFGVFATNSSNPTLGWQNCSSDYYGRNSFDYSYIDDRLVYAGTGCTIMAEHCWWGTSSPSSSLFYGSVDYTPYLSSAPSSLAPNPEGNLFDQRFMLASAVPDGSEEASEDLTRYYNDQWDLDKKIGFLRYLFSIGEAKGVADLCKDIIYENPYASESFLVLDMMYQISKNNKIKKDFDKEQLKAYIESFDDKMGSQLLKSKADLILAGLEKNMPLIDKVYKKNIDTYLGKYALQQKFMYYYHEEENLEEARTALDLMDEVYPDEIVTYEAHVLMGDEVIAPNEFYSQYFNTDATEQAQLASTDIADILPVEFELYKAYPNPFNPSTTLEYALPVQSKVECSIYSISGELVKSFNFDQVAGTHSVTWDGAAESSGIYLVRFTAEAQNGSNSFVDYQKVTLLK
ncbi:MAG: T9SS type A sorting domain-containing protein [Candidatus Marinimicrobia bacterium]|nr:T9SS type A sorting domain-containing protein [Candidatus Neomarinimicrobiota bacterium]